MVGHEYNIIWFATGFSSVKFMSWTITQVIYEIAGLNRHSFSYSLKYLVLHYSQVYDWKDDTDNSKYQIIIYWYV